MRRSRRITAGEGLALALALALAKSATGEPPSAYPHYNAFEVFSQGLVALVLPTIMTLRLPRALPISFKFWSLGRNADLHHGTQTRELFSLHVCSSHAEGWHRVHARNTHGTTQSANLHRPMRRVFASPSHADTP